MRLIAGMIAVTVASLSAGAYASAEPFAFKDQLTAKERHHLRADLLRRQALERAQAPLLPRASLIQDYPAADTYRYAALSEQIARLGALVRADEATRSNR